MIKRTIRSLICVEKAILAAVKRLECKKWAPNTIISCIWSLFYYVVYNSLSSFLKEMDPILKVFYVLGLFFADSKAFFKKKAYVVCKNGLQIQLFSAFGAHFSEI